VIERSVVLPPVIYEGRTVVTPTEDSCVAYARLCTQMAVACEDVAARRLLLEMARDWMAVAMDEPGLLKLEEAPAQAMRLS
jgi:hypothetical protein